MLKRVFVMAGAVGTILALAAVGCSGSSNDLVGGGDAGSEGDGSNSFSDDGGKKIDSGPITTDGGTRDGGVTTNHDGGTVVVTNDAGVVVDSGTTIQTLDAGVVDAGTVVETDGGVSGSCFMNTAAQQLNFTGLAIGQNRCTPTQITEFNTACLGAGATTAGCSAVVAADGDCSDCLFGGNLDGGLGVAPALLPVNNEEQVNITGCLAAISTAPDACKNGYQQVTFCADTTCATCVTDNDNNSCQDFAETDPSSICEQDFAIDGTCVDAVEGSVSVSDAANKCAVGATDFSTAYQIVATTMCGAP